VGFAEFEFVNFVAYPATQSNSGVCWQSFQFPGIRTETTVKLITSVWATKNDLTHPHLCATVLFDCDLFSIARFDLNQ
jgi:hypothetical protein